MSGGKYLLSVTIESRRAGGAGWSHRPEISTNSPHVLGSCREAPCDSGGTGQLLLADFVRVNICAAQSEKTAKVHDPNL